MPGDISDPAGDEAAQRLISLAEAAEFSGLSPDHLRRLVRTGVLWGTKIGRNWVTTRAAVTEYIARDRRPGPKPKSSSAGDKEEG